MFKEKRLITLNEVLDSIQVDGEVEWVVTHLDAVAAQDSSLNILELESRIAHTQGEGVRFTYEELLGLSRNLSQVIDCNIRGFRKDSTGTVIGSPVVVLDAFDSTEWTVSADHESVSIALGHLM